MVEQGAHELEGRGAFRTFAWGDELPGGIVACEVDALSPDETALHIPAHRALAIGDGVVRWQKGDELGFVPDFLMDDPRRPARACAPRTGACSTSSSSTISSSRTATRHGTAREELSALVG